MAFRPAARTRSVSGMADVFRSVYFVKSVFRV